MKQQDPLPNAEAPGTPRLEHVTALDTDDTTCPRCEESHDLAKVKGCVRCLTCGFKFDCNGW